MPSAKLQPQLPHIILCMTFLPSDRKSISVSSFPTKKVTGILSSLHFILLASLSVLMFCTSGTISAQTRLGIHYSAEELAIWRQRAKATTEIDYATNGDVSIGSPGDWARIKGYADEFLANPNSNLWQGSTSQGDNYPMYEGIKLQCAAFAYQIFRESDPTLANRYAAAVRTGLLAQIAIPRTNISLWNAATVNEDGVFESKWITRLAIATDYMSPYLSAADKTTLNAWFLAQANFMANHIQASAIGQCFPRRLQNDYTVVGRDAKPTGETYGIWITGNYADRYCYTHVNANGSLGNRISQLAIHWNNRRSDKVIMYGTVGVLLNNSNLVFQAKQYWKEWLKYSVYPDGTQGEYQRNGDYRLPQQGMGYGAINQWGYIQLADALARKGDMELYNYSTSEGIHGTQGGQKTLQLTCEKYCKNIQSSPAIYYKNTADTNKLDGYGESRNIELAWEALFSVPNKLWKSAYIKSIYTRTAPNLPDYPVAPRGISSAASVWYPWGGCGAEWPGVMLMAAQLEEQTMAYSQTPVCRAPENLRIPFALQRSTRFIWDQAIGALKYNLRFKANGSSTWITKNNLLDTWFDTQELTPATQYEWQVQSVGQTMTSTWASATFVTTPAACTGQSRMTREIWTNVSGLYLFQTSLLPFDRRAPNSTTTITSLEAPTNISDRYAARMRGFICAPSTGSYKFWVAGDDEAELWLSTDDSPLNATKIASCKWTEPRQYTKYSTQQSANINLIANQKYYIEIRHLEDGGNDNVSVRWQMPNGTIETPIAGSRISPWQENNTPSATLATSASTYTEGDSVLLRATAADPDGSILRVEFYKENVLIGSTTRAPFTYTYQNVPAGNYTFSAIAVDNRGAPSNEVSINTLVSTSTPTGSPCATGKITREFYANVIGNYSNQVPTSGPTSIDTLTKLEVPGNSGDNYGERVKGYICPPNTGNYTFWVSGDNQAELWLSTTDSPNQKRMICSVVSFTGLREYGKEPSQKSTLISLVAGQKYYIELVHKEGTMGDHASVQWQLPNNTFETPIPGSRLSPFQALCTSTGTISQEIWTGVGGFNISQVPVTMPPTSRSTLTSLEAPVNSGDNFGRRLRGYICAPQTGSYTFYIAGDDRAELWLSPDANPATKARVAYTQDWVNYQTFNRFPTQQYQVNLVQGQRYYVEVLHKESTGSDHVTVGWTLPSGAQQIPIAGSNLSPFTTGVREQTEEPQTQATPEDAVTLSAYPNPASDMLTLATSANTGQVWEVALLNMVGQTVHKVTLQPESGTTASLSLQQIGLQPGAYIVQMLDSNGKRHSVRFLKN
jgi:hypothetical protein